MTKISELNQDSSSSFSDDSEENRVRRFAKSMLKSSLFIGTFLEKRFVEPLNAYRAVIKIADDEKEFIENLLAVKKRCIKFFSTRVWIGITEPQMIGAPAGYNVWVDLDEEVFGSYWYKVKNVRFLFNEIALKLEVVRPLNKDKSPIHVSTEESVNTVFQGNVSDLTDRISASFKQTLNDLFTETLTWPNIKQSVVFVVLLISTIITMGVHTIKYLLDYFLKLLHETSSVIKVCTPIIISFMKIIMNTINGLYTLIAIIWTNSSSPPKFSQRVYQISPYEMSNYNNLKMLPAIQGGSFRKSRNSYGSSVRITPLD